MSHQFETGNVPQRTLVQQGAVDTLAPLRRASGGYLADVIKTGVVIRSYLDEAGIGMLLEEAKRTPCIAVATAGRSFETTAIGGREAKGELDVLVYFLSQHGRGMQTGRMEADVVALADATTDPGLHIAMQHALELLIGTYPTTTTASIKQLFPVREDELATLPEITIWMQTWRTRTFDRAGAKQWRTAEQLLTSIGWRATTDPAETVPPAAATTPTSIDEETDI